MKNILIATDFSDAAYNAAVYGVEMAKVINTGVVLLHVYQLPIPAPEMTVTVSVEDTRQDAEFNISSLKRILERKGGGRVKIETAVIMGSFYDELKILCEQVTPYTVIMGSQGETAAERLLFGSHAVYTMKHLTWPVITVPPDAVFSAVRKIGLACDFDNIIDSIRIDEIKRLVTDFHAELHVLNTSSDSVYQPDLVFETGMLRSMIKDLNPQYHFIRNDDVDSGIMEFADNNQLDLLVVMPKRHSLVERIFHKSHTRKLVLHSHVPVMALHL